MAENTIEQDPISWWNELEEQWQLAFSHVAFNRRELHTPSVEELQDLITRPVLRIASPGSMYPNTSVDLTNLSGLSQLRHVELLFVQNHLLSSLEEIADLTQLKQLVLPGNKLTSLKGIEKMTDLEKLHVQNNELSSIAELSHLTKLVELYVFHTSLSKLDGLGPQHKDTLKQVLARPNPELSPEEISRIEEMLDIQLGKGA